MMKPGIAAPGMAERLGVTVDERRGVEYHQLRSKDLLNKLNARPMPFGWTLNPYRGCEMACRYCFARYTHEFLGLDDRMAFERTIYVKDADRDRLVAELRRARRSGQSVAIGTATDPYQPAEGKFEVTRRVLEGARDPSLDHDQVDARHARRGPPPGDLGRLRCDREPLGHDGRRSAGPPARAPRPAARPPVRRHEGAHRCRRRGPAVHHADPAASDRRRAQPESAARRGPASRGHRGRIERALPEARHPGNLSRVPRDRFSPARARVRAALSRIRLRSA